MSFGFALVLPDGVFVLADGRQVKPLAQDAIVSDEIDKVQLIHDKFALIPFGLIVATDVALRVVRENWRPDTVPDEACQLVESAVEQGWSTALCKLAADVDRTHPSLRCALVGGGVLGGKRFVTATLVGFTSHDARTMDQTGSILQLGGEDLNAPELARRDVQDAFDRHPYDVRNGPCNATITELVRLISARVVSLSSRDGSIGGRVTYAVFRHGYPAFKACTRR